MKNHEEATAQTENGVGVPIQKCPFERHDIEGGKRVLANPSLIGPEHAPYNFGGDRGVPAASLWPGGAHGASGIWFWQPLPNGGCNLPAASTFPLTADCRPAELNEDLWFFLFLITGQPCLPDFSEAQTRFLPRSVSFRPAGPPQYGFPKSLLFICGFFSRRAPRPDPTVTVATAATPGFSAPGDLTPPTQHR